MKTKGGKGELLLSILHSTALHTLSTAHTDDVDGDNNDNVDGDDDDDVDGDDDDDVDGDDDDDVDNDCRTDWMTLLEWRRLQIL